MAHVKNARRGEHVTSVRVKMSNEGVCVGNTGARCTEIAILDAPVASIALISGLLEDFLLPSLDAGAQPIERGREA